MVSQTLGQPQRNANVERNNDTVRHDWLRALKVSNFNGIF